MEAHFAPGGHPDMFHVEHGGVVQTMHRGPGGVRIVEGVRPAFGGGMVRVVAYGGHRGFVERPIMGRPGYMRRSYLVGGRPYAVVFRGYHYRGIAFYRPIPAVIYRPAFYGWAVHPWARPIRIQVGFVSQPWYGVYGTTFAPYPVYASPDQWMTDQMLADNMQQAYDAGRDAQAQQDSAAQDAGYASAAPPPISPELKQQINAQIQTDVQEQGQAALAGADALAPPATSADADEVPDALKPGHTVFRVVAPVNAEVNGQPCTLNSDDWIIRSGDIDPGDGTVPVKVATSRSSDCTQGATTKVALNELMTMQNDQDQQVAILLKKATETMGKDGMPVGPAPGATPVPGGQAQADLSVATDLKQEQGDASAAEQQVVAASTAGGQ